MAQESDREKAAGEAGSTKRAPAAFTWTFLGDEAENLGLIARNPAPNAAGAMVPSYAFKQRQGAKK